MSLRLDKQGRYVIDLVDPKDGKRKRDFYRCSFEEAQVLHAKRCLELEIVTLKDMTLNEFKDGYLQFCERQKGYRYKRNVVNLICREFGHTKLSHLKAYDLERWQGKLLSSKNKSLTGNIQPATVNRRIATLKHMYTKAVDWGMIEEKTLKEIHKIKMLKENNKRLRYLTEDEAQKLITAAGKSRVKTLSAIIRLALTTGMRRGEILGLRIDEVDLQNDMILLKDTKNNERREIPLCEASRAAILEQLAIPMVGCPYVFHYKGKRIEEIQTAFENAKIRAGIVDFHFHDLRHTFASWLVQRGKSLYELQKLLGHKSYMMTQRYAHLAPNTLKETVKSLDGIFNKKEAIIETFGKKLASQENA